MKQNATEKDDPLRRIQEEINEVARRERELRETMLHQQHQGGTQTQPQTQTQLQTPSLENGDRIEEACNCEVVDKDHSDDQYSVDSGISAPSSPVNGTSANPKNYIRPNGYNTITPNSNSNSNSNLNSNSNQRPQTILLRTVSTPHIFITNRRINFYPVQKGIMQRFIASRGKVPGHTPNSPMTPLTNGMGPLVVNKEPLIPDTDPLDRNQSVKGAAVNGRPIRRGYVPVEEKIQKELRDLKSRETELKRMRKLDSRQSQPNLLSSIEDEEFVSEDEDSDVEHCYPPGKWRSTKSIGDMCDGTKTTSSRTTPSPNFDEKVFDSHNGTLRPAVSLAQLCDLTPEEAPSSHRLIAKWESLIQQNSS